MRRHIWQTTCILLFTFLSVSAIASEPLVTVDVVNGDVRAVYNSIAVQAGYNIVISPSIRGAITVKLEDVSWRKALEVVLETMGQEVQIEGNTIFVAPMKRLR